MIALARQVSSRRAADALRGVFRRVSTGFAFRLWDGTLVPVGHGPPVVTIVIHQPETFVRLMRDPSPLNFAEAYVDGALDLEGDLFEAMRIADEIEEIHLSPRDRLRIFANLWRA